MNNTNNISNNQIQFMSKHVGGDLNDTVTDYKNQSNLIKKSSNEYVSILNYHNKLLKDQDSKISDEYIKQLDAEQQSTLYRINNVPTIVENINLSNPKIYPKEYDPYFEYLHEKNIKSINTQIIKKQTIVNVDSINRQIVSSLTIQEYTKLNTNSLIFTNASPKIKILLNNSKNKFIKGDKISLRGFKYYSVGYKALNIFFTDNSNKVILDIKPNFDIKIPYYDIIIKLNGINADGSDYFNNIPLNIINQTYNVNVVNHNNDSRFEITIPLVFHTTNTSNQLLISDCSINYYNIGNFPISLINANLPITEYNLTPYLNVDDVGTDYINILLNVNISLLNNIKLSGEWTNLSFATGSDIEIGKILTNKFGYYSPNIYSMPLISTINNVCCIKMISSEIPNVQNNIFELNNINVTSPNNKLYWDNVGDVDTYSISIPTGYYQITDLKTQIENLASKVKRTTVIPNNNLYKYANIKVEFDTNANLASFRSFSMFIVPNCLHSINEFPINSGNYNIKIQQNNHNLRVGDNIIISNAIDYYYLSSDYLNNLLGQTVTNIISDDIYEIKILNVNKITDVGNTKGGAGIKILTPESFRLRFDKKDTIGNLIGFRYVGDQIAITNYSIWENNYTITNLQPYVVDISKILVINNLLNEYQLTTNFNTNGFNYILLLCDGLNFCTNPNNISYFYKFQLNGQVNKILYNTFVNTPIIINPPIKLLSKLDFTFVDPNGNPINFYGQNNSFTLEITNINNAPSNTNINTGISRI